MNVSCPNCATVYRVDPAKVPSGGVRARCSVCSAVFAVRREGETQPAAIPVAAPAAREAAPAPVRAEPMKAGLAPTAQPALPRPEPPKPLQPEPPRAEPPRAEPARVPPRPAAPQPTVPTAAPAAPRPAAAPPARPAAPAKPVTASPPATLPAQPPPSPAAPRPAAPAAAAPATARPASAAPAGGRPANPFLSQDPSLKARRLARALISDMVVYHPGKRQEGLRDGNLKELFEEEIKKSWEEYAEQVGREVADSTPYFKEALNEILAGGRQVF